MRIIGPAAEGLGGSANPNVARPTSWRSASSLLSQPLRKT
jgi:hypothetical protein